MRSIVSVLIATGLFVACAVFVNLDLAICGWLALIHAAILEDKE
jgi:hypothetical protein